jgi:hypothetical protein
MEGHGTLKENTELASNQIAGSIFYRKYWGKQSVSKDTMRLSSTKSRMWEIAKGPDSLTN